jgi:hypothetical protein
MIGMLKVKGYKLQANKLSFFFGASELNGMSINPFKTDSSTAKCRRSKDNTMAKDKEKRTNYDLQNTTHQAKD